MITGDFDYDTKTVTIGNERNYKVGDVRIKNTGRGADWYGKCERCGKHCSTHYKQQRKISSGWLNSGYGHIDCLKKGDYINAYVDHDV